MKIIIGPSKNLLVMVVARLHIDASFKILGLLDKHVLFYCIFRFDRSE